MNLYSELAPVREDVEKYLLPHEIIDEYPLQLYYGGFKKIPVWVYWHQGFGSAPDIVKLCVASIRANIPDNCELILLDKYNIDKYTKIPSYVTQKTGTNYTHSSNMLRAALLYLYGGMWLDATFLLTEPIPAYCFENDFWSLKNKVVNPDDKDDYIEQFAMECMYSEPNNPMLLYIYNMLCNYWRYNDTLYHYFLKDGIIDYGYNNNKFPRRYLDDLPYSNPNRFAFNANNMNGLFSSPEYERRTKDTIFFKETYKFGVVYQEMIRDKLTFYGYFKFKYLPDETNKFSVLKQRQFANAISQQYEYVWKDIIPNPQKVTDKKFSKIPVWTLWLQGEDEAPDIVKMCINSIRANLNPDDFEVIVLNKDNIKDYINLPDYVLDRVGTNYTHLALLIRFALVYLYGGLWIDSTYLLTEEYITKDFLKDKKFWSFIDVKGDVNNFYPSLFYAEQDNDLCLYLYKSLCKYWKNNCYLEWYHLVMSLYYLGYKKGNFDISQIDSILDKRSHSFDYYGVKINGLYSEEVEKLKSKLNIPIFKTTYKQQNFYKEYNNNQELTFYGYFKNKYLKEN